MDVNELLLRMLDLKASDLHLKVKCEPTFRINGDLHKADGEKPLSPEDLTEALDAVTTPEQRAAFAQQRELDMAYSIPGVARFRLNLSWQRGTIAFAFRVVPFQVPQLDELALPEVCKTLASSLHGLVLVTGSSGSGKSTTLAAMVRHINETRRCHIVTIEDPIEFLHTDRLSAIMQREVGSDTLSFPTAISRLLRQDPDVVMVGEMRELETIATALTIAETGHLVLATLHTTNAAQAVDRIVGAFPPGQQALARIQLSMTLEGILCQTLVPTADGKSRVPAVEVLVATQAVRNLIREMKTHQLPSIIQTTASIGMQSLDQALANLHRRGLISIEEALKRAAEPAELRRLIGR